MLARLGLRAGDVACLRLTDIDWNNGTLRVTGKGRYQVRLPLPQDVGDALLREGFEKARSQGLLTYADVHFCKCIGLPEAEIEDMYEVSVYEGIIYNKYHVSLQSPKFKGKGKWSDRMRETFQTQGKHWDDRLESEVKHAVAEAIAAEPGKALNGHK